jgi:WD40 repeat protein
MESSTRTTPRKTKKKWSKTEWLLLLAPLLVIGGLALMNFAPQVKRSFQEWREYGNNRPYAVFYAGNDLTYNPIAFSPDGKYLAAATRGTLPSNNGNHGIEVWETSSRQRVSSWPLSGKGTSVTILKFVSPSVLDVGTVMTINVTVMAMGVYQDFQSIRERRDTRSGKLLSNQQIPGAAEVPPDVLSAVSVFSRYQPRKTQLEKLGKTKFSFKLLIIKTPIQVKRYKAFVVQWMAQVYDPQGRKLRKPFALSKYFDFSTGGDYSASAVEFCSLPDGKTLFIHTLIPALSAGLDVKQDTDEWIEAFDTTTGRSLWKRFLTQHNKQNGLLRAIAFSPNSNATALLIDQYQGAVLQSGNVELRNTRKGNILRQFQVRPFTQNYSISLYMQFSPDGRLLAIPQDDRLELWDVSDLR